MRILLILISFLYFTLNCFSQNVKQPEDDALKKLMTDSFEEIWCNLDSRKITNFYTIDFLLLENGKIHNNDTISNYLNKTKLENHSSKREHSLKFIKICVKGDMAWVVYRNDAIWTADNKITSEAHWLESATMIMTNEGWKLNMLHSTLLKDESKPANTLLSKKFILLAFTISFLSILFTFLLIRFYPTAFVFFVKKK